MYWTEELFHVKKPIIAMCHLRALPGDPYYDKGNGMKAVVEQARAELRALQDGGVDAVTYKTCRENGAEVRVTGSAYFTAADRAACVEARRM